LIALIVSFITIITFVWRALDRTSAAAVRNSSYELGCRRSDSTANSFQRPAKSADSTFQPPSSDDEVPSAPGKSVDPYFLETYTWELPITKSRLYVFSSRQLEVMLPGNQPFRFSSVPLIKNSMIRRIISLILIPALLANQTMLCCAHTHPGLEPDDHPARAHVHWFGHEHHHGHSHDHHHGDSGEHHHGDSDPTKDSDSLKLIDAPTIQAFESGAAATHDQNTIYLGEQVDLRLTVCRISLVKLATAVASWPVVENLADIPSGLSFAILQPRARRAGPLGMFSTAHCAIFLQTSRLLI
jgi:hypothetical protein